MKVGFPLKKLYKSWIIFMVAIIITILFNEFIVYEWCFFKWNMNYNKGFSLRNDDLKILFVADPQLIGLEHEKRYFENVIRWDADRFLSKGFSRAVRYAKPDFVVFLGDIFDEGESASDSQYQTYLDRFHHIFTDELSGKTKVIILPGDNDEGGEGPSKKLKFFADRFRRDFKHQYPYVEGSDRVNFIVADMSNRADFEQFLEFMESNNGNRKSKYNMLFNHNSVDVHNEIMSRFKISAIISAHTHLSRYQICDKCPSIFTSDGNDLDTYTKIEFQLTTSSSDLLEITVPTCSYRMGVPYPGYGYMTISREGFVGYAVLWLPYRFTCLRLYQFVVIILVIFAIIKLCRRTL